MKKLNFNHVMKAAKIIKDGDVKEQIVKLAKDVDEKSETEAGVSGVMLVVDLLGNPKTSDQVSDLLTDIFGQDVKEMPVEDMLPKFKQLGKENNLLSFFKSAGNLTQ